MEKVEQSSPPKPGTELSTGKKVVFTLIMLSVAALGCLVPAYWAYQRTRAWAPMLKHKTFITPAQPLYRDDSELGYAANPGRYRLVEKVDEIPGELAYDVAIEDDGSRATSASPGAFAGKPEIWVFGCSFTWGQGLSDAQTYPFVAQQELPAYHVKNFGENGYGTLHALIRLRSLLKEGKKPAAVVVGYLAFHPERNVGASSFTTAMYWFSAFQQGMGATLRDSATYFATKLVAGREQASRRARLHFPAGYLDASGKLATRLVPLLPEATYEADARPFEVTKAIFDELVAETSRNGIRLVVLHLWPVKLADDAMVAYLKSKNVEVVDAGVDYGDDAWNLNPHNGHPNARANRLFADRLTAALKRNLNR